MPSQISKTVYRVKLLERFLIASQTLALKIEKPRNFVFRPGQYVTLGLPDCANASESGDTRTLSITSAPQEHFLMLATRLRNTKFKQRLSRIALSSEVTIDGPGGGFAMDVDAVQTAVFIAGGIGITPVRSILVSAARNKLPRRTFLFYSNRRPEDAAFLDELTELQNANPHFHLIATMTRMQESNQEWTGSTGHLNWDLIAKYVGDTIAPVYYLVGPPRFVDSMRALLVDRSVDFGHIRAEDFGGY